MHNLINTTFVLYIKGLENTRLVFTYPLSIRFREHNYEVGRNLRITDRDTDLMNSDAMAKIINICPKKDTGIFGNEVVELEIVLNHQINLDHIEKYHNKWFVFMSKGFPAGWILMRDQCLCKPTVST